MERQALQQRAARRCVQLRDPCVLSACGQMFWRENAKSARRQVARWRVWREFEL